MDSPTSGSSPTSEYFDAPPSEAVTDAALDAAAAKIKRLEAEGELRPAVAGVVRAAMHRSPARRRPLRERCDIRRTGLDSAPRLIPLALKLRGIVVADLEALAAGDGFDTPFLARMRHAVGHARLLDALGDKTAINDMLDDLARAMEEAVMEGDFNTAAQLRDAKRYLASKQKLTQQHDATRRKREVAHRGEVTATRRVTRRRRGHAPRCGSNSRRRGSSRDTRGSPSGDSGELPPGSNRPIAATAALSERRSGPMSAARSEDLTVLKSCIRKIRARHRRLAANCRAKPKVSPGTPLLVRWSGICRVLGLSPSQACSLFGELPSGSQRFAWDDLARHVAARGTA